MPDAKLTIEDLAAAPYNPRKMSDKARAGLGSAIERFGDISGITFNVRTGRLVCGHQRVERLRAAGAQMVDGALQLANGARFPVRVVDWSEGMEKEANVTANNPNIAGTFSDELEELLLEIEAGMSPDEFSELELDALLKQASRAGMDRTGADTSPQLPDGLTYSVIVDFDNQDDQGRLVAELEERGLKCRLLMS